MLRGQLQRGVQGTDPVRQGQARRTAELVVVGDPQAPCPETVNVPLGELRFQEVRVDQRAEDELNGHVQQQAADHPRGARTAQARRADEEAGVPHALLQLHLHGLGVQIPGPHHGGWLLPPLLRRPRGRLGVGPGALRLGRRRLRRDLCNLCPISATAPLQRAHALLQEGACLPQPRDVTRNAGLAALQHLDRRCQFVQVHLPLGRPGSQMSVEGVTQEGLSQMSALSQK
mmetsp:Transcript_80943/g.255418  ORF Transcript_80943/g.255418 Transcript_80943/m.255418 type:complete len:230 (-) Transcript_80943:8-697(-)